MRWCLLALALLVTLSLTLAWLGPAPVPQGARLHALLTERHPPSAPAPTLRTTALPLLDFTPTPNAAPSFPVRTGDGGLPGRTLTPRPNTHWSESRDAQFVWHTHTPSPLRTALTTHARPRVWSALARTGHSIEHFEKALAAAEADLAALSDGALLQAWLQADSALLDAQTDLAPSARQALLLATRPELTAPVLTFPARHAQVYALPLSSAPGVAALELHAYDPHTGALLWQGTLSVTSPAANAPPDPARVRHWAAHMAALATPATH